MQTTCLRLLPSGCKVLWPLLAGGGTQVTLMLIKVLQVNGRQESVLVGQNSRITFFKESGAASGAGVVLELDPVPSFWPNSEPGTQHDFIRTFEYLDF